MVAKRWVPEVSGGGEHQWSTFNVWRHHWIVALLSALANTPPPQHTSIPKPSSWHPPPALGRLGGTWELNLYHPSERVSNISGVQLFTGDRRGDGTKSSSWHSSTLTLHSGTQRQESFHRLQMIWRGGERHFTWASKRRSSVVFVINMSPHVITCREHLSGHACL